MCERDHHQHGKKNEERKQKVAISTAPVVCCIQICGKESRHSSQKKNHFLFVCLFVSPPMREERKNKIKEDSDVCRCGGRGRMI